MKFYIIIVTIFYLPSLVTADRMLRFLFNNNVTAPTGQGCTAADDVKIDAIFATPVRRALRASSERELRISQYCTDNCRAYTSGTCRFMGCSNWRRNTRELVNSDIDRELQTTCATATKSINDALNNLITTNAVTTNCKTFLNPTKRIAECYDDVIYGVIENVSLWNVTGNIKTLVTNDITKFPLSVCKSFNFNIEAVVNTCVDFVNFHMVGPMGYVRDRTENDVPYTLFGDDLTRMYGQKLTTLGQYTLTITPDGFDYKKKSYKFTVKDC